MSMERRARDEVLVREINENIQESLERSTTVRSSPVPFVCECADPSCTDVIELTLDEYQEVRAAPTQFAVLPGHESEELEVVVDRQPGFLIVEKTGPAGEIAEAHDPN